MLPTQQGKLAEDYACSYLQKAGLTLLKRNFRYGRGEIDLIMQQKSLVVFVEVRYRKNAHYGSAIESIDLAKKQRLRKTAHFYLQQFDKQQRFDWRYDWLGLSPAPEPQKFLVEWLQNAWEIDD
jgi:putative endonuclease